MLGKESVSDALTIRFLGEVDFSKMQRNVVIEPASIITKLNKGLLEKSELQPSDSEEPLCGLCQSLRPGHHGPLSFQLNSSLALLPALQAHRSCTIPPSFPANPLFVASLPVPEGLIVRPQPLPTLSMSQPLHPQPHQVIANLRSVQTISF